MNIVVRRAQYFRLLELCAALAATALVVFTGISMKWVGFSRVFGMYLGMFFLPIALLELMAVLSERFSSDRLISKATLFGSLGWTAFMILPVIFMILDSSVQYQRTLTSEYIWRQFPDRFPDLLKGSTLVVVSWLVPIGILSGFLQVLRRLREEEIRWSLILWQIVFMTVIAWGFLLQKRIPGKLVSVGDGYFSPLNMGGPGSSPMEVAPLLNFALVLLFWCALFVILRYCIGAFGAKNCLIGVAIAVIAASAIILLPAIPPLPSRRGVDFQNYSGWYTYRAPGLIPLRVWAASLLFVGIAVVVSGIGWVIGGKKRTQTAI